MSCRAARWGLIAVAVLASSLFAPLPGRAHTYVYFPYEWQDTAIYYHFTPSVPTTGYWRDAFRNAANRWSNISMTDGFFFEEDAPDYSDFFSCDYANLNTVKLRVMDGPDGILGLTLQCYLAVGGSAHLVEVKIHLDSEENWYVKSKTPNDPSTYDLQGVDQ